MEKRKQGHPFSEGLVCRAVWFCFYNFHCYIGISISTAQRRAPSCREVSGMLGVQRAPRGGGVWSGIRGGGNEWFQTAQPSRPAPVLTTHSGEGRRTCPP